MIWLDVTTTMLWSRAPVGIVRTEIECIKYALTKGTSHTRFCTYDRLHGFDEITPDKVRAKLASLIEQAHCVAPQQPAALAPGVVVTRRRRILNFMRKVVNRMPRQLREWLISRWIRNRHLIVELFNGLGHAVSVFRRIEIFGNKLSLEVESRNASRLKAMRAPFHADDVYVTLGLDWDNKNLESIYHLKSHIGFKSLHFCYDLIPVLFPHLCVGDVAARFSHYFVDLCWTADHVMCISERSKLDLIAFIDQSGADRPTLSTIYLGSDALVRPDKVSQTEPIVEGDFVLYVSTVERRKNHRVLYEALIKMLEEGRENVPKFVFVGMRGWGVGDLIADLSLDPRVADRVVLMNGVSDERLEWLLANCLFTVFPSLYEGWGLGVAESLAHGKFCICSNSASLPEAGGPFVEYLDPVDTLGWAQAIAKYTSDREALAVRERSIRQNYVSRKWSDTAQEVFATAANLIRA